MLGTGCSWADFSQDFCLSSLTVYLGVIVSAFIFIASIKTLVYASHRLLSALERLCEEYDISEDVAGATVLAFGGSVPELLVNLIATSRQTPDVGVSAIVGSGLIAFLAIPGGILLFSPLPLVLHRHSVLRDSFFYLLALLLVFANRVTVYLAVTLVLVYVGYLYVLLCDQRVYETQHKLDNINLETQPLVASKKIYSKTLVIVPLIYLSLASLSLSNCISYWTYVSGVSQGYLSFILISLGAEIPDAINAFSAASRGHGSMALASCLGAQVVNLSVGLGVPWLLSVPVSLTESFSDSAEKVLLGVVLGWVVFVYSLPEADVPMSSSLGYLFLGLYLSSVLILGF